MRNILAVVILLILVSFKTEKLYSQDVVSQIDYDKVCAEMKLFIKSVKSESIRNGKYNVYLAKLYESNNYECCITMEYIFTELLIDELHEFKYFTIIDSALVLMSFSENFKNRYNFNDVRIDVLKDNSIISNRVSKGSFFGDGSALVSCFGDNGVSRKNYLNDSYIPVDKRIFVSNNEGEFRRIDSTEFKKNKN